MFVETDFLQFQGFRDLCLHFGLGTSIIYSPGAYADSHLWIQFLHQNTKTRPLGSQHIHCGLRRRRIRSPNHRSNHQLDLLPSAYYDHCMCWAEERSYLPDMDTLKKLNKKGHFWHRMPRHAVNKIAVRTSETSRWHTELRFCYIDWYMSRH